MLMAIKTKISLALISIVGSSFIGCAQTHQPAKAPSVAAVRNDLQTAKAHIEQAAASVKAAGGDARSLDALINQVDDKNVIILRGLEKYRPKP